MLNNHNKSYTKLIKSVLSSKFLLYNSSKINNVNLLFVINNKSKQSFSFFFIIIVLMLGIFPSLLINKRKVRNKKYNKFVAFKLILNINLIFKILLIHLPVLDIVNKTRSKSNRGENFLVLSDFPIINEIDVLCERHNSLLEHINSYKLIINTVASIDKYYNWYYSECLIRLLKLNFLDIGRKLT